MSQKESKFEQKISEKQVVHKGGFDELLSDSEDEDDVIPQGGHHHQPDIEVKPKTNEKPIDLGFDELLSDSEEEEGDEVPAAQNQYKIPHNLVKTSENEFLGEPVEKVENFDNDCSNEAPNLRNIDDAVDHVEPHPGDAIGEAVEDAFVEVQEGGEEEEEEVDQEPNEENYYPDLEHRVTGDEVEEEDDNKDIVLSHDNEASKDYDATLELQNPKEEEEVVNKGFDEELSDSEDELESDDKNISLNYDDETGREEETKLEHAEEENMEEEEEIGGGDSNLEDDFDKMDDGSHDHEDDPENRKDNSGRDIVMDSEKEEGEEDEEPQAESDEEEEVGSDGDENVEEDSEREDDEEEKELVAVMTENITEFLAIFPQVLILERNHSLFTSLSLAGEARHCGHADRRKAYQIHGHDFVVKSNHLNCQRHN